MIGTLLHSSLHSIFSQVTQIMRSSKNSPVLGMAGMASKLGPVVTKTAGNHLPAVSVKNSPALLDTSHILHRDPRVSKAKLLSRPLEIMNHLFGDQGNVVFWIMIPWQEMMNFDEMVTTESLLTRISGTKPRSCDMKTCAKTNMLGNGHVGSQSTCLVVVNPRIFSSIKLTKLGMVYTILGPSHTGDASISWYMLYDWF